MTIATYDELHIAFIEAVAAHGWEHHSVPATGAALEQFLTSKAFTKRLMEALVEVEEAHLNPDCLSDSCDHLEGECPEYGIGCHSAAEIADWMRPRKHR